MINWKVKIKRSRLKRNFAGFKRIPKKYIFRLTSELLFFLPLFLITVIFTNLFIEKSTFQSAKENILLNKNPGDSHAELGKQFLQSNQIDLAKLEFDTALSLTQSPKVRSEIQLYQLQINKIGREPRKIVDEIIHLQKFADMNPDYRDAYLQMAIFNWKLQRNFAALKNIESVLEIDPNNKTARRLLEQVN